MTKRQAQKEAAHTAARLIESYMEVGQPWDDCANGRFQDHRGGEDCPDCKAIVAKLQQYIDEADRRAS